MKSEKTKTASKPILKVMSIYDTDKTSMKYAYIYGVYLCGVVEKAIGYDIVVVINFDEFELRDYCSASRVELKDGIYQCEVKGYDKPCTAYIWHRNFGGEPMPCGFIVDNEDEEYLKHAIDCYGKQKTVI